MSLAPLTRLGPYEIVARLGAGAMGEVYRATDSRLGRDVAIKILPADVASDPGRRARFEQEARAVAALNHPNILGLYDIGNEDGVAYLVTEFVNGETLAAVLERGPMALRKMLDIAVQIADGMAAAHAARITHRDLKPLNIMVGGDGRVKILDFGLAKQAVLSADPDATQDATHTQPGMIIGTVNYMSPEQARGVPTDYRSDQFSFGMILYEMAAGKRPFDRAETVQTMSAIIGEDAPPIEQNIPAPLRWTIERCLAKDPADRFESSRDLFQGLRSLRDHASEATSLLKPPVVSVATAAKSPRRVWPAVLVAGFLVGVIGAVGLHLLRAGPSMPDQSAYHFAPFSFAPGGQFSAIWAPDGKSVAYAASQNSGPAQTFIRYLDAPTPIQITHTEEEAYPIAWAPDGKHLLLGLDREPNSIWSIATVGGDPELLVPSIPKSRATTISPDNQSIAYLYPGDDSRYGVWISSPLTAAPKRYLPDPFATKDLYNEPKMKFSPDGKQILLYWNAGRNQEEAWILPYPPNPSRPPHRVLANIQSYAGTPSFSWMPDSRHVVLSLAVAGATSEQLWLGDTASGEHYALTSGTTARRFPAASPDGGQVIFRERSGTFDIVGMDLANAVVHPVLATERDELMPAYAAHKPLMAYVTNRNGPQELWLHSPDNSDRPLVTAHDFPNTRAQWLIGPALSPEADRVVYTRVNLDDNSNRLWISAVSGGVPVQLTNNSNGAEFPGSWSPDGSWFAYVAFEDGKTNLQKVKTSGQAPPVLLHADASYDNSAVPIWSPSGDGVLLGETLYAADGKSSRSIGEHRGDAYVFSPDGTRLYGLRPAGDDEELISVDIANGSEKVVGKVSADYRPASDQGPAQHLTLSPDGHSIVYGVGKFNNHLWLLEGFAGKQGLLAKFGF